MNLNISESYKSLSNAELLQLERDFDVKLPNDYKTFLLQNNGGIPSCNDYMIEGEYFGDISCFFSVKGYLATHDIKTENMEVKALLPVQYIAIGASQGGNLICLCLDEEYYGSVYCWDHELANYDGPASEDCMIKISNNLREFLCSLYIEE